MAEIEPKTREEKLWNGEDIEPVTREEMYIKHIFDKTQTIPDHPITRKEMLMEKAGEGGGGDITIKQLTVTENRTYSEEGTAYSPVIVNVPDVPPVLDELTATENGTYTPPSGTDGYNEVNVSVQPKLETLTAIENDTYTPSSGKDGFSQVVVNVPPTPLDDLSVTENGTYNPTSGHGFGEVTVNVSLPDNAYLLKSDKDDVVSFNDGSDNFFRTLKAYIEPVQSGSGEPSPSNIRPISGWTACNVVRCGKNLFDKTTIVENKIINSNTGEEIAFYGRFSSDYIKVKSSTDYYATDVIRAAQWYCVFYYDKNKNYLSCGELPSTGDTASGVITTPSNCNYARLVGITTYKDDVSFVVGNQATTYEPYTGTTYTIQFTDGSNPLTVYGGYVDIVSGVLTVDKKFIDVSSMASSVGYNWGVGTGTLPNTGLKPNITTETISEYISNCLKSHINSGVASMNYEFTVDANSGLLFKIPNCTSANDYQTWVTNNNLQIVGELATPQTYQLTAQQVKSLLGVNNVWADTGETEVEYFAKEVSA